MDSKSLKGSTAAHQKLVDDILYALGSRPDVRLWIRVVGFDRLKKIRYGIPGESDLDGIVAPWGIHLSIEVKSGNAKMNEDQIIWKKMIERFGGWHILAKSVEQVIEELNGKIAEKK